MTVPYNTVPAEQEYSIGVTARLHMACQVIGFGEIASVHTTCENSPSLQFHGIGVIVKRDERLELIHHVEQIM